VDPHGEEALLRRLEPSGTDAAILRDARKGALAQDEERSKELAK
jgi:hypothetical protein